MMGRLETQENLFYRFRIEDHVPQDHLLRRIDWLLDFDANRQELAALYSHTGRPSVDPELMLRMLLVGYLYGIRSERRLVEEVHLNLAYRSFWSESRAPDRINRLAVTIAPGAILLQFWQVFSRSTRCVRHHPSMSASGKLRCSIEAHSQCLVLAESVINQPIKQAFCDTPRSKSDLCVQKLNAMCHLTGIKWRTEEDSNPRPPDS